MRTERTLRRTLNIAALALAGALLVVADSSPLWAAAGGAGAGAPERGQSPRVQSQRSSGSSSTSARSSGGSAARSTSSGSSTSRSSAGTSSSSQGRERTAPRNQNRDDGRGRGGAVQSSGNYDDGAASAASRSRTDRRGSYHGSRDHRYYGHPRSSWSVGVGYHPFWYGRYYPYYSSWDWGWWWGWGGYYGPPVQVYYQGGENLGALDLDLRPERAEVFVNGQRVGIADNFDGFPSYLWLEQGTYDVVFYLDGYQTLARQYTLYPGVVIDVEDAMVPGEATRPEELPASSTAVRDERLRRDQENADDLAREDADWRARADDYAARKEAERTPRDARAEPGLLHLSVLPGDASVYLDGRFLGTGTDLGRLHAGLLVDAGEHELEVVHPAYASQKKSFTLTEGDEIQLEIALEPKG